MSSGKVVQVIGAVIDVEFPRDNVPQVYDALTVGDNALTLEVQQQLGDGVVRAIAMGPSEGVSRGLALRTRARQFRFLLVQRRWVVLWMCLATRLTRKVRSESNSEHPFTALRPLMTS